MRATEEAGGIAERLRQLRTGADLSQQALAQAASLSWSVIASIEQGKSADPKLSTLRALAKALGVSLDELAG